MRSHRGRAPNFSSFNAWFYNETLSFSASTDKSLRLDFAEHLLPQRKHVQIQLREDRNVRQNDNPQEVIVREGEIDWIRQFDAPYLARAGIALGPVETQQLTGHSDRVQRNESGVSVSRKTHMKLECAPTVWLCNGNIYLKNTKMLGTMLSKLRP